MIGGSGMAGVWIKNFIDNFSDRVKVVGLCDVDQQVLDWGAKVLGLSGERLFTDFNEACAKVKADFCGIAIPPQFHSPAAIVAMENGMPVICEKPIADTLEAAKAMLCTSQKTGQPCSIIQQFRHAPNKQELVRIREEGRLGRLQHILGRYADDYRRFMSDRRPHRRLLFESCIHHFDMLRFLSGGDCETLMGFGWNPEWSGFKHWSSGLYLMRMTNGVHTLYEGNSSGAGITTNWHSYYRAEFELGTVEIDGSERVIIHRVGQKPKAYKAPKITFAGLSRTPVGDFLGHVYLFDEFLNWLDGGSPSATRIEDNIQSFAMIAAATEATVDGQPKRIADYLSDLDLSSRTSRLHTALVENSIHA
ncbi:Gfo/Idh/MocA family oxidoreductase [candidate division KSB1 bacterium]|nr:Gfo/Idh/MocA family oxidoreductase [candidate division KSB1 bacterium]NIV70977.1 Gfo/Idh/MocA family oxidoreductase [Phycisphaerae bacterium]NIR73107.1 Gfo/Idh/MocA family oxidoreductase [candidate division KSB1 bacterium]NIT75201.1 Gfo/Idh/MocA family oxidoreductase [candidate division KSB1 bacterium]NIU29040.1 Gfo/Idh/MocA family oxidoreductase [candidate division KSB1 bacterium]